jgi:hypothetical protein
MRAVALNEMEATVTGTTRRTGPTRTTAVTSICAQGRRARGRA